MIIKLYCKKCGEKKSIKLDPTKWVNYSDTCCSHAMSFYRWFGTIPGVIKNMRNIYNSIEVKRNFEKDFFVIDTNLVFGNQDKSFIWVLSMHKYDGKNLENYGTYIFETESLKINKCHEREALRNTIKNEDNIFYMVSGNKVKKIKTEKIEELLCV